MVSNLRFYPQEQDHFLLTWESDAAGTPIYRVYRDGLLVSTQTINRYRIAVAAGEFPVFEVLDNEDGTATPVYPGWVDIGWYADSTVASYDVQQYLSGVWTSRGTIPNDGGSVWLSWKSEVLADGQTHQFRVIPTGTNGNAGTAAAVSGLIVRYPDPPQVRFSYDSPLAAWSHVQDAGDTGTGGATVDLPEAMTPSSLLAVAIAFTGNPAATIDLATETDAVTFIAQSSIPAGRSANGFTSVQDFSAAGVGSIDLAISPAAGNTLLIVAATRSSLWPAGSLPNLTLTSDHGLEADVEVLESISSGTASIALYRVEAAGGDTLHLVADQIDAGLTLFVGEYSDTGPFNNLEHIWTLFHGDNPNLSVLSNATADRDGELIFAIVCFPQAAMTSIGAGSGFDNFRDVNLDANAPRLGIEEISNTVAGVPHAVQFSSSGAGFNDWMGIWVRLSSPAPPIVRWYRGISTVDDQQVIISCDDPNAEISVWVGEYLEPAAATADGNATGYGDSSSSPATSSVTVSTAAGELLLAAITFDPGGSIDSPGSGFTQRYLDSASTTPLQVQQKIVTAAQAADWSGSVERWMGAAVSLKRRTTGPVTIVEV